MSNSYSMYFLLPLLVLFTACEKKPIVKEIDTDPIVTNPIPVPPKGSDDIPADAKVYTLGTGSGNLSIDGKSLKITGNALIKIKGGSYDDIQISNLGDGISLVYIQNDGLVEMVGNRQMTLSNLNNVKIVGNGNKDIDKGFLFHDKTSDAPSIQLKNDINNFTLQQVAFNNIATYNAIQYDSQKVYDGSPASYSKNLKFLYIDCNNTGTLIRFKGSARDGKIVGLVKNVEIAYLNYKNSRSPGSVIALENADSYDLHNNTIQSINQDNNNHNGVFYVQGNGKFYNNYVRDHQGNAIRAWTYSIGTSPATVLIYNNIVINSRMYSAFEVQSYDYNMMSGKTTYANAKVFDNTCGNILPKADFPAQILDLYGLQGGTCEVFNNLGYNFTLVGQNNTNFIWNELSSTKATAYSNKYFRTYQEAGIENETGFKLNNNSPAKNAGSSLTRENLQDNAGTSDYYGVRRNTNTPSIGAVE